MKIKKLFENAGERVTLSFEVFPPKADAVNGSIGEAALRVAALMPSYMSVTCGAGGSGADNTIAIAQRIQDTYGVPTIAHLTCVGMDRERLRGELSKMREAGIENVLALRGDRPRVYEGDPFAGFQYASEVVSEIRGFGGFCIGGACYPEGHVDAASKKEDIKNLKIKTDAGCDFLMTQMFFDNNIFYNFLYRAREAGISVPIIPGIMPITRASQVKSVVKLSGCNLPERFKNLVDRFGGEPAAMQQAGIIYATDQIIDLIANGITHIHVYSMNKAEIAAGIMNNLSEILK